MRCNEDCFNCPFPDCANDYVKPYNAEYRKKYHIENREAENEKNRQAKAKKVAEGLCRNCGRPIAQNSKVHCIDCLLKIRKRSAENRRKKGGLPRHMLDGVVLCSICGKEKPVEGYKVCQRCLENNRRNIQKAHENRNLDTCTNGFVRGNEAVWRIKKSKKKYWQNSIEKTK